MNTDIEKTEELLNKSKGKNKKKKAVIIAVVVLVVACIAGIGGTKVHKQRVVAKSLDQAEKYMEESDYDQAIKAYTAAIDIDEKNVDAYKGRAEAYMGQSKPEEAAEDYIQAIVLGSNDEETCRDAVEAAVRSQDDKILKDVRSVIEDNGKDLNADEIVYGSYAESALAAFRDGNYDEAKRLAGLMPAEDIITKKRAEKMTDDQKTAFLEKVKADDEQAADPENFIQGIYGYALTDFDNDGGADLLIVYPTETSNVEFAVYRYDEESGNILEMHRWSGRNIWVLEYPDHEGVIVYGTDTSFLAYYVETTDGSEEFGSRDLDVDKIDEQMITIGMPLDMHVKDEPYNENGPKHEVDYSIFECFMARGL